MKLGFKLLGFQALVVGYVLLFFSQIVSAPFGHVRLLVLFVIGAVMVFFTQGPQYGTIEPISTRPLMIALGVIVMAVSHVWGLAIRNHL